MNLVEIRTKGIGSNFTVSNQEDGFRKDNAVWFGTCDTCGESVVSSSISLKFNGWVHEIREDVKYHADGLSILSYKSKAIDYCPKG
jgi:hypothetical protein